MDIAPELLERILAHAREEAPNECCGVVAVAPASDGRPAQAMRVRAARNIHASPKRFEIDGKDVIAAINEFDEAGWDIGAIYHSHTHTAPYPSQTDINFAASWPGVEWIIVGLSDPRMPEIRSYLIEEGTVHEVEIGQIAV
ncbi:MAG TPA: M67 family metallopeptidase [Solirubrobacteraceae bacterium]|jgi:proteasome lid subunit RPN8/RPN11|nr:M67 family metallopeptidase [Solirubrobacteraceae bacterium]